MAKKSGRVSTANPKFKGAAGPAVSVKSGMSIGGLTDAEVRKNAWSQGTMLHKQLKKNKSGSSPL